ncbi:MAG: helix-hairpin-helix domain-containing protein [Deltaproteobacteria bacterium]|nr:helix-hairpin-helix domain-containing protein [Deltaproteobacteria bacterium]
MDRARYGAFIALSLVFLAITFLHSPFFRSKPPGNAINDGQIYLNAVLPAEHPSIHTPPFVLPGFPIDLNKASKEELMLLPGVGPRTAERIMEKRLELGGFSSIDELTSVRSIGKVRLEKVRKYAVVSPPRGPRGKYTSP